MKIIKFKNKTKYKYKRKVIIKNDNVTGEIINVDSGQRLAWLTPDIINTKE